MEWWAARHGWGQARRRRLEEHLNLFHVYDSDRDLCRNWAEVTRRAERSGGSITCADAWIAATALTLGVPLVTHNPADFAGVEGLEVISEAGDE